MAGHIRFDFRGDTFRIFDGVVTCVCQTAPGYTRLIATGSDNFND